MLSNVSVKHYARCVVGEGCGINVDAKKNIFLAHRTATVFTKDGCCNPFTKRDEYSVSHMSSEGVHTEDHDDESLEEDIEDIENIEDESDDMIDCMDYDWE